LPCTKKRERSGVGFGEWHDKVFGFGTRHLRKSTYREKAEGRVGTTRPILNLGGTTGEGKMNRFDTERGEELKDGTFGQTKTAEGVVDDGVLLAQKGGGTRKG